MPVEEAAKKKHKLFPFNILRKRSTGQRKGKSKSLVNLYDVKERKEEDKRNDSIIRKKRLSQQYALNSSLESHNDESNASASEDGGVRPDLEYDLETNKYVDDRLLIDNDETDGCNASGCNAVGDFDATEQIDSSNMEGDEDEGLQVVDDMTEAEGPNFPPGTTVCNRIFYALMKFNESHTLFLTGLDHV